MTTDTRELVERLRKNHTLLQEYFSGTTPIEDPEALAIIANLHQAITALEQQAQGGGWMPIETAPKDGSHILLYRKDIQFVGYYGGADSGWRINAPRLPAMWPLPTHWREKPLPPAPDRSEER